MTLANLLSESQIIPEMAAKERWQAIRELVDCLVASGKIQSADEEEILESIRQREETMSTGIGFGIAIPHASSSRAGQIEDNNFWGDQQHRCPFRWRCSGDFDKHDTRPFREH